MKERVLHMVGVVRAWASSSTLRVRISLALLLAVAVAVSAGTVAHLVEVSSRLERDLAAQVARVVGAIRTDLEQTAAALDDELEGAADSRAGVARSVSSGRVEARLLGAQARLVTGRLEVLKVLQGDGTILTSGHWPASFGALDPLVEVYRNDPGRLPRVLDEATPDGSAPTLERWVQLRVGTRTVFVVAGRFLDSVALERMRSRTGADLLALCPAHPQAGYADKASGNISVGSAVSALVRGRASSAAMCTAVRAAELLPERPFVPDDRVFRDRLRFEAIDVGGHTLWIGLDRSGIERVRAGIIGRAIFVGLLAIIFAVILGGILATRLVRPIESLAAAARRLAGGDLSVRVESPPAAGDEVRELVESFNTMAQDLERDRQRLVQAERVAAWQEIARGLAHELKNPLTPILGAIEVIQRAHALGRGDFAAILDEQGKAVVEEVMRLKELADAFARFARLPEQRLEALSPSEVVDHAVALYATSDTIEVRRRYEPGLPPLTADRKQLQTVVVNLVKNAVEAMEGKGILALTLRSWGDESASLELIIDDSGPGISPDIADRLFTPYVTTKGSRGTGLGLALVHRIVVEHGGTIEAGRSDLTGARFVVRLPFCGPRPLTPQTRPLSNDGDGTAAS